MSKKHDARAVFELAGKFIAKHEGAWDHEAWEKMVDAVAALGFEMHDEARRNLGHLLEAGKYFQAQAPVKAEKPAKAAKSSKSATASTKRAVTGKTKK